MSSMLVSRRRRWLASWPCFKICFDVTGAVMLMSLEVVKNVEMAEGGGRTRERKITAHERIRGCFPLAGEVTVPDRRDPGTGRT